MNNHTQYIPMTTKVIARVWVGWLHNASNNTPNKNTAHQGKLSHARALADPISSIQKKENLILPWVS